jgi:6-hydroxycyclohex-1-ene-1-carbonyl-CoA dehydrogenase
MTTKGEGWYLETPGKPLVKREITLADPGPGDVIVEVLACGLCHTDLTYASGATAPKHALPLVLGHEVVGKVIAAGDAVAHALGKRVIVPAVMGCGECAFCKAGRANACLAQKMPGNDVDGGFATHLTVPGASLVNVDDVPASVDVRDLSVVADAVSTAQQAIFRSGLGEGDVCFVVGSGGVGAFVAQIAKAKGAHVIAFDVDAGRLELVKTFGAELAISVKDREVKELRKEAGKAAARYGVPSLRYRIFECSGTQSGQLLAYALIAHGATMVQVGYTPKPVEVRLSNLMAFDATIHGSWGAPPQAYADVLPLVYAGQVALAPFTAHAPMSRLNELLDDMAAHKLDKRMVLDPRA